MSGPLRAITIALALFYFAAAAYHSGVIVAVGASVPAAIAETLLGLVLVALLAALIGSARLGYLIVLAGTLFGLTIILLMRDFGIDLWIHVVMLVGIAVGLGLDASSRGRAAPTPRS